MGTKVGSDSGKFGVLSPKRFNDVFVVFVYFILFYFHKMQAGRSNTKYLRSVVERVNYLILNINTVFTRPFFTINTPELR